MYVCMKVGRVGRCSFFYISGVVEEGCLFFVFVLLLFFAF